MTNVINRPYYQAFDWRTAIYSASKLDQVHKLCRNFVASLDLGCPSAKHVKVVSTQHDSFNTSTLDDHHKYLMWVCQWKENYRELSRIIRKLKTYRRTVQFPILSGDEQEELARARKRADLHDLSDSKYMNRIAALHLGRLAETAQVMLNARWNGSLASRELRRIRMRGELRGKLLESVKVDLQASVPNDILEELEYKYDTNDAYHFSTPPAVAEREDEYR